MALPTGPGEAGRVSSAARVIATDTPNDNSLRAGWGTYRTGVDALEAATGSDLLSAASPAVQPVVEARVGTGPTG